MITVGFVLKNVLDPYSGLMRILTWNVLKDLSTWWNRRDRIVRLITDRNPDVIAMQEVPDAGRVGMRFLLHMSGYTMDDGPIGLDGQDRSYVAIDSARYSIIGHHAIDGVDASIDEMVDRRSSRRSVVVSYHGAWGSMASGRRLLEVSSISKMVKSIKNGDPDCPAFIMGDFNAVPAERSVRYMLGLDVGRGIDDCTYWTDAQIATETRLPYGTSLATGLGASTAEAQGIRPSMLPVRIIDHIMSLGWNYGKNDGWYRFKAEYYDDLSDHALLMADTIV